MICVNKAKRLEVLEEEMQIANEEYVKAVNRASEFFFVGESVC